MADTRRNHVVQTRVTQETYERLVYLSELENRKLTDTLELVLNRGLKAMAKDEKEKAAFVRFKEALEVAEPDISFDEAMRRISKALLPDGEHGGRE